MAMNYHSKIYQSVLDDLKGALVENKITQSELGEALGIKQSAVSSLLAGKSILTLDQFLTASELVGIRPHKVLSRAEMKTAQVLPMPTEFEAMIHSSEVHLLAYCAATKEITADELAEADIPKDQAKKALDDLTRVGVLIKKKDRYLQKEPSVTYQATNRARMSACHAKLSHKAWLLCEKSREKPHLRLRRFNYFLLDRLTLPQMKEIEAALWRIHEKAESYRRENLANGYTTDENMPLWNVHMMLTNPLENK